MKYLARSRGIKIAIAQALLVSAMTVLFTVLGMNLLVGHMNENLTTHNQVALVRMVTMARNTIEPVLADVRAGRITKQEGLEQATTLVRRMTYIDDYGQQNYIFMSSYDGVTLVQPFEPQTEGENRIDLQDAEGRYIIRDLIEAARSNPEGGFTTYLYYPPGSAAPEEKISFVIGLPELDSYIGTGMYMGRIYREQQFLMNEAKFISVGMILLMTAATIAALVRINERQKAVEKAEQNLRSVFNNIYDAVILHDREGRIIAVNQRMQDLFGVTREQAVRLTVLDISAPDHSSEQAREVSERAFAGEELVFSWKIRNLHTGEIMDAEVALRKAVWDGQEMILAVVRDIRERKQFERELLERQRYLEHSQRLAHVGHYHYDILAGKMTWSKELYRIYGVDPALPPPTYVEQRAMMEEKDWQAMRSNLREHSAMSRTFRVDFPITRADGQRRILQAVTDWVRDENGNAITQFGSILDITEFHQAQQMVQRELEMRNGLLEVDRCIINRSKLHDTLSVVARQAVKNLGSDAAWITLDTPGQGEQVAAWALQDGKDVSPEGWRESGLLRAPISANGHRRGWLVMKQCNAATQPENWHNYLAALAGQAAIAIDHATLLEGLSQTNQELEQAYEATIAGWSRALELRDKETRGHSERVINLSCALAKRLGMPEVEMVHFRRGVFLHDIGKMAIPDSILLKPGSLSSDEWTVMRQHPEYARRMLEGVEYLRPALQIPYCHHERWNGSGYPRGLKGEDIPLGARIFAVIDVWDAMISDRPYRPALPHDEVKRYLREQAGVQLDPGMVDEFLKMLEENGDYA